MPGIISEYAVGHTPEGIRSMDPVQAEWLSLCA